MVKQIQLKNYRSHKATGIDLGPFNLFLGPMGSGKTSMLHALSLLLCGQNPLINAKSEGLRREISIGESDFQIACRLDSGMVIDQRVTKDRNSIGVDGAYKDVRAQRGRITGALGNVGEDCLQALLDPSPFFERDEKAQRKVLLQLMSSKEIPAPPLVLKLKLAESFTSVGQIDELIKDIKDVRVRGLNRDVETLQKQIPEPVDFSQAKLGELQGRIRDLKAQRDKVIKKQGAVEEWERALGKIETDLAAAKGAGELATLEASLVEAQKKKAEAETAVAGLRENYAKKAKGLSEAKEKAAAASTSAKKAKETLAIITHGMGERCGVSDVFKCPLKPKEKAEMGAKVQAEATEYEHSYQLLDGAVKTFQKENTEIEEKAAGFKKTIDAAVADITALERKISHNKDLVAQLAKHRAAAPEGGNWPGELATASEALASAEIDIAAMTDAQGINSRRSLQVAEVVTKQTEAESLLAAVKELAQVKDALLQQGSSGFVDIMSSIVTQFGFKEVVYSSEPFGFFCDGLLPDQMSGGQKVIVEAALRLAAAKTSGLNLMAIDNTNMTGEGARNKLANTLMASGVQVIVCSTTDVRPQIPKGALGEKSKVYWFTNTNPPHGPSVVTELGV